MARRRITELFRLLAVDGQAGSAALTGEPPTLLVLNPLEAPIYFRFGKGTPGARTYDLVCPEKSFMAWPIEGSGVISAVVDYPGAVPAGDADQVAIISTCADPLGPAIGVLSV